MCSIAIPSELLLGHSPPVYGSLLYSSLMVTTPPIASRSVPPQIRPCLASGSLQLGGLLKGSDDAANNNRKNKKRVVFADDRGRPLTQVRVMSEPSNMPPLWTSAYVASLARGEVFRNLDGSLTILHQSQQQTQQPGGNKAREALDSERLLLQQAAEASPWEAIFSQPASDYLAFRAKLDRSSVSLENVIVRESEQCLVGTVKVKNIAYDKEVAIRVTSDNWASHDDVECSFVEQPGLPQAAVRSLYDTFRFRLTLPQLSNSSLSSSSSSPPSSPTKGSGKSSHQIEFCVRYRSGGAEFWDNNNGANYVVKKKRQVTLEEQVAELLSACCGPSATHNGFLQTGATRRAKQDAQLLVHPVDDATKMHLRTWSEFASWQHLENDAPYW